MNGWMSWVTASSPAMNCAHSRVAHSRSRSVSASQSARSREKSISAGFQNSRVAAGEQLQWQAGPVEATRGKRV